MRLRTFLVLYFVAALLVVGDLMTVQLLGTSRERVPAEMSQDLTGADLDQCLRAFWILYNRDDTRMLVPDLAAIVKDGTAPHRYLAADLLCHLGPDAAAAVPALIEALDDNDPRVRLSSIRALERIGPAAQEAVPALRRLLQAQDRSMQRAAGEALTKIAPQEAR